MPNLRAKRVILMAELIIQLLPISLINDYAYNELACQSLCCSMHDYKNNNRPKAFKNSSKIPVQHNCHIHAQNLIKMSSLYIIKLRKNTCL